LVRPIVARLGERRAMLLGLGMGAAGFATFAFAGTGAAFTAGIPLLAFFGVSNASLQGLMTGRVAAGEQGRLQGANGSLTAIAELIGPGIFTFTFASFVDGMRGWQLPGAAFLLAAALLVCAM